LVTDVRESSPEFSNAETIKSLCVKMTKAFEEQHGMTLLEYVAITFYSRIRNRRIFAFVCLKQTLHSCPYLFRG